MLAKHLADEQESALAIASAAEGAQLIERHDGAFDMQSQRAAAQADHRGRQVRNRRWKHAHSTIALFAWPTRIPVRGRGTSSGRAVPSASRIAQYMNSTPERHA